MVGYTGTARSPQSETAALELGAYGLSSDNYVSDSQPAKVSAGAQDHESHGGNASDPTTAALNVCYVTACRSLGPQGRFAWLSKSTRHSIKTD